MFQLIELNLDEHRKAVIIKVSKDVSVAIIDVVPLPAEKRDRYSEEVPFNNILIVKRKVEEKRCHGYDYDILEEAVCFRGQETCTVISYIVYIVHKQDKDEKYVDKNLIDIIKCIAFTY